ncbi:hypothetical protein HPB50_008066 [Hyalomma asiaticum]|uniref:Uncharacterized protein n=1 Tax=Hyalomma asiaticum TaxID=266040 RepID=A0ACB7T992_HYAAI|nr:hypothetical protein HPB50_008066 [Hyalomma asiaticum]
MRPLFQVALRSPFYIQACSTSPRKGYIPASIVFRLMPFLVLLLQICLLLRQLSESGTREGLYGRNKTTTQRRITIVLQERESRTQQRAEVGEGQGCRGLRHLRRRRRLRGRGGVSRKQRRIRGGGRRSIDGCNGDRSERLEAHRAEEVAIALAVSDLGCTRVVSAYMGSDVLERWNANHNETANAGREV